MSEKMTSRERFLRMFDHVEADRVAMWDFPWPGTIRRWHEEGMPEGVSYEDYFGVDKVERILVDNSPRFPVNVVEETDEFITVTTAWGGTQRDFKAQDSTPDFIDFTVKSPDDWVKVKERISPTNDRVPWDQLKKDYKRWKEEGSLILADMWFSFDHTHSLVVGTERLLMALVENPEWCMDMFTHFLDVNLALLDMTWDAGYTFDVISIRDDMGYKQHQFFSPNTYREMIKPLHKRVADWAHSRGIKARLHSCGYIMPFIPDIIDAGIDVLHPMEVKAGMDPVEMKKLYGDDLTLHGGFNAMLWSDKDAILAEIERLMPIMKENGGYIFASDHSIPSEVSFENAKAAIGLAKELGRY